MGRGEYLFKYLLTFWGKTIQILKFLCFLGAQNSFIFQEGLFPRNGKSAVDAANDKQLEKLLAKIMPLFLPANFLSVVTFGAACLLVKPQNYKTFALGVAINLFYEFLLTVKFLKIANKYNKTLEFH